MNDQLICWSTCQHASTRDPKEFQTFKAVCDLPPAVHQSIERKICKIYFPHEIRLQCRSLWQACTPLWQWRTHTQTVGQDALPHYKHNLRITGKKDRETKVTNVSSSWNFLGCSRTSCYWEEWEMGSRTDGRMDRQTDRWIETTQNTTSVSSAGQIRVKFSYQPPKNNNVKKKKKIHLNKRERKRHLDPKLCSFNDNQNKEQGALSRSRRANIWDGGLCYHTPVIINQSSRLTRCKGYINYTFDGFVCFYFKFCFACSWVWSFCNLIYKVWPAVHVWKIFLLVSVLLWINQALEVLCTSG